jgi:sugar phosphate isomerase/epimerase
MDLGMLTAAFPGQTLGEVADWASANGFQALEVACWPSGDGAARRYAGVAHIDVDGLSDEDGARIAEGLAARGLRISALAYYANPLHPEQAVAEATREHLRKVIAAAPKLGVDTVATFIGNDRLRPLPENLATFREVWPPIVALAGEHGVRIAIENCPMIFSYDEWPGGNNMAYSPGIWRELFAAIPDAHFGLNLDPSHLVWQFIDAERAVREFGERILHVHGKDLEVLPDGLYEQGVMSAGTGWQVPRLCGLGQVDWGRFFGALYAVGYDGVISVENEDRRFEGSLDAVRQGFLISRNNLAPYLA